MKAGFHQHLQKQLRSREAQVPPLSGAAEERGRSAEAVREAPEKSAAQQQTKN